MKLFLAAAVIGMVAILAACGDDEEVLPTDSPTPPGTPGEIEVSWEEAKEMLRDCRVTMVGQAHSLDVGLTLEDGTQVHTKEPGIDDVLDLAFDAQKKCGGQPKQIVTE